jgi:hypothetical protein
MDFEIRSVPETDPRRCAVCNYRREAVCTRLQPPAMIPLPIESHGCAACLYVVDPPEQVRPQAQAGCALLQPTILIGGVPV